MTFKEATDRVLGMVTLDELAKRLGVSRQLIAQARLETENRRSPPEGWERALRELALQRATELEQQAAELRAVAAELDE